MIYIQSNYHNVGKNNSLHGINRTSPQPAIGTRQTFISPSIQNNIQQLLMNLISQLTGQAPNGGLFGNIGQNNQGSYAITDNVRPLPPGVADGVRVNPKPYQPPVADGVLPPPPGVADGVRVNPRPYQPQPPVADGVLPPPPGVADGVRVNPRPYQPQPPVADGVLPPPPGVADGAPGRVQPPPIKTENKY